MTKESTTKLDLNRDFNINGVQYNAGKGVEVRSEHVQAIKDIEGDAQSAADYAATHHGAVPAPSHPQEATAQTPTRPLGAPEVRQDLVFKGAVSEGPLNVVDDKGQTKEVASKEAAIAEGKKVEEGKTFDDESNSAK